MTCAAFTLPAGFQCRLSTRAAIKPTAAVSVAGAWTPLSDGFEGPIERLPKRGTSAFWPRSRFSADSYKYRLGGPLPMLQSPRRPIHRL